MLRYGHPELGWIVGSRWSREARDYIAGYDAQGRRDPDITLADRLFMVHEMLHNLVNPTADRLLNPNLDLSAFGTVNEDLNEDLALGLERLTEAFDGLLGELRGVLPHSEQIVHTRLITWNVSDNLYPRRHGAAGTVKKEKKMEPLVTLDAKTSAQLHRLADIIGSDPQEIACHVIAEHLRYAFDKFRPRKPYQDCKDNCNDA